MRSKTAICSLSQQIVTVLRNDLYKYLHFVCCSLLVHIFLNTIITEVCGLGSSVSIATELRGGQSGIDSQWGRDFPPVHTGPGAHTASCKMGTGSFPGGKVRLGRAADHSPPSSAVVMEE